jgi:hypothetical protein
MATPLQPVEESAQVEIGKAEGQDANVPEGFSGKAEDFQKDLEMLTGNKPAETEAVTEVKPLEATTPEAEPVQPEQPQATETETKEKAVIPDKFRNPDGTVNQERIEKSTMDADTAYQKYREAEIALKQQMNKVNQVKNTTPVAQNEQQVQPEQQETQPNTFAAQIEADVKKHGLGAVLERLHSAAEQSAVVLMYGKISNVLLETELSQRQRELESIAKNDSWVFTKEGIDTLSKIRQDKPWVNGAPEPWKQAYKEHLADRAMKQMGGSQVQKPTPSGQTAPATPVGPVSHPKQTPKVDISNMNKEQLDAEISKMDPKQQAAFFASQGLRLPG